MPSKIDVVQGERPAERQDDATTRVLAAAAPVVFLLLWASGFAVAKVGLRYTQPLTFLTLRYAIIVALFLPLFLVVRPPRPARRADWMHVAVVGFLIQFVYFGLAYVGMNMGVSAGVTAVITSTQPLVVALASPLITGQRVGPQRWLGLLIGAAGAAAVVVATPTFTLSAGTGLLLVIASTLGMAAATLYQKRFVVAVHPITVNLVHYTVGLVCMAPLAFAREPMTVTWTPDFIAALLWIAVANSVVAISLLLFMIGRGEAARVSSLFFLVPPCAALFGWVMLGERLTLAMAAGMVVAVAGVWLVSRSG